MKTAPAFDCNDGRNFVVAQTFRSVWMGPRPTTNNENPVAHRVFQGLALGGWASGPRASTKTRSIRRNLVVGQAFVPAAGLPPGAEPYVSGGAGDLVAGVRPPRSLGKIASGF
jgi:hypothetical protein